MESRLGCRLETSSKPVTLLSLGAQPLEVEIPAQSGESTEPQHPVYNTVLRLLKEAHDFLDDITVNGDSKKDVMVSTSTDRFIDVPAYCLRAVAQCQATTRDMGVFCGCRIARAFLQHLYRLEDARATALANTNVENCNEHAEDLLTRLLRYTATQLALVMRVFQTALDR